MVVAPFPVTLTMCVTVKANALNEERARGTDVDVRANTGFVVAFAQYRRDKDLKTQETHLCEVVVSCGDVQLGDRGRSKETLRALACRRSSFSLPEGAL